MFSDPSKDFQDEASAKLLLDISSKPLSELGVMDFIVIFQRFCPPGTVKETLPYVNPLFAFVEGNFFIEGQCSHVLNVWENFIEWFSQNDKELERSGNKQWILTKIENLFAWMNERGCEVGYDSLLPVAREISEAIVFYANEAASLYDPATCFIRILDNFKEKYVFKAMIILCAYHHACSYRENKKLILAAYNKQELHLLLNAVIDEALTIPSIPDDLDNFIVESEEYLMFESH